MILPKRLSLGVFASLLLLFGTPAVLAQGKGGGKGGGGNGGSSSSVTVTFFDREGDRVRSVGGQTYSGMFNDAGNLIFGGGPLMVLDLVDAVPVGTDPCASPTATCDRGLILGQVLTIDLSFRVDAIESMQPGETRLAEGQISFGDPQDPDLLWRIKYEHFASGEDVVPPGSFDNIQVICTDADGSGCVRWVLGVTDPSARAALVSTRFGKKGKPTQTRVYEGSFQVPFLIEVTRP